MDENVDKKNELFNESWQQTHFFCRNMNKRNKVEVFYVGLFSII
jgi:hypothetical protein